MKYAYLLSTVCLITFLSANKAFAQPERAAQFQEHKVKEGETASSISDNFHVKKKDFLMLNNFPPDIRLKPGQIVLVKQLKEGEKPIEENWNTDADESSKNSGPAFVPSYSDSRTHVKSGAATEKNTEPPATTTKKADKPTSSSTSEKEEPKAAPKPASGGSSQTGPGGVQYNKSDNGYHTVEKGQTFYRIALIYGLTVDKLKELNNMSNTQISVGQKLKVK